jgi:hypothetical protein
VPTMHLQDLADVDPRDLQRNQHLDHELVARRRNELGRRAKPAGQLVGASRGDLVALARPLAVAVGRDEPVPLEALQSRVDLADIERPDVARPRPELVLQPQAVLRPSLRRASRACGTLTNGSSNRTY